MESSAAAWAARFDVIQSLRAELATKIARLTSESNGRLLIDPGILLATQTAPSAPCMNTYEPSVIVVAQGTKRVDLGSQSFTYDRSRYLLTAVDLPLVSQVVEASARVPMHAMKMRLDMAVVRELLSGEEVHVNAATGDGAGLVTGEITPELLSAFTRFLDLVETPQHMPFLSGLIQREVIYRILSGPEGARLRAIATLGDQSQRTAKAVVWLKDNFAKQCRVEDLAEIARMGVSTFHHHFRTLTSMSPVQYQKQLRLQAARGRLLVILSLLVGCALRRRELASLSIEDIQMREGRWVIADLRGKGNRVRTVAVPLWVKQGVNAWLTAAKLEEGRLLRPVSKVSKLNGDKLSDWAVWSVVEQSAKQIGIERFGAHDLRRTCAKLCRKAGGDLEQIKLLLGHSSFQTTERYLGSEQEIAVAVNDNLGL